MAVLVTRPDSRGEQLTEALNKAGVAALHMPLFSISAGRELNELPNKMYQLKAGDYVFAVSKNAVEFAAETLSNTGFRWRQDLIYFAVGQSSAEYFCEQSEQPVHYPYGHENSEGLLALPQMQRLTDKTVLILRGNGGRELFPAQAVRRGAQVEIIECYRRVPVEYDPKKQTDLCQRAGINTIIATSSEILTRLTNFVPAEERDWLTQCRLVTASYRVAKSAERAGWQKRQILIAPRADNATLVKMLAEK
ncbi:uroporphyrinogen-III synthase [Actinobacillus succinogenes]|uniref:Uroporphyrinogen-III synthase n=1 Tax=Actinobacillus succinogenes (strain ATCC 55618 / DSM 22257 / CCUG 43843 / 130Z) TaxID=339671 RepID=A6VL86_ACTSZ|nr:uroporphyrinogen-III synthase [Actinobacillus succinogenes]ABR73733.1 Uroporphyrinogen III synthase HEM4 [Actinobacillus succinogenes 130Z]PHI39809.1 uroporphyrinogen-III synthase [Actinobacillus succinogenes]